MLAVTLADIEAAHRSLAGQVVRTPILPAPKLSALTGAEVYVKYENLQVTGSFKDRGAYVRLMGLTADERRRGVVTVARCPPRQCGWLAAARSGQLSDRGFVLFDHARGDTPPVTDRDALSLGPRPDIAAALTNRRRSG